MLNQADRDKSTEGRGNPNNGQVEDLATGTTLSLLFASADPSGRSGPDVHNLSLSSHFQGTQSSSEDKITDDLLHSPTLLSRPQPIDTEHPASIEAAVWDWQALAFDSPTQADNPDSSPEYSYEPQGELLLHQNTGPVTARADEFSISAPVVSSAADPRRPPTNPLEALLSNASLPGNNSAKRKPTVDVHKAAAKRPNLNMGDRDRMDVQDGKATPVLERRNLPATLNTPLALPARKVFPIQIGDKLFRLSGASISSDAPSYFSQFFEEQLRQHSSSGIQSTADASSVRTLYIDRDPSTFCDISLHLQGYHIEPRDGAHFVKLFADAQFFSLPRLTSQLFSSPIYTTIGSVPFQIPRDIFSASPGNEPNYFTLGFQIFFTTPSDAFPGLSRRTLLRPPSLLPPSVPNRDAEVFADLLRLLKGYEVEIRSDEHRQNLLRDARYFNFRGVEQRLIRHRISYNSRKEMEEIEIRIEDVRQNGISIVADKDAAQEGGEGRGIVFYARPYADDEPRGLVLEIGDAHGAEVLLDVGGRIGGVGFEKQTAARMRRLAGIVNEKNGMGGLAAREDQMVVRTAFGLRCEIGGEADVVIDGKRWKRGCEDGETAMEVEKEEEREREWVVRKSQWRVRVGSLDSPKMYLEAVKLEGYSRERTRVQGRGFL